MLSFFLIPTHGRNHIRKMGVTHRFHIALTTLPTIHIPSAHRTDFIRTESRDLRRLVCITIADS
uniref:Uncharacterized protein n=1 Tax=Anguilla anguilla TaxID=7936 RepID=A0A0E9R079_ANGAN